MTTIGDSDFVPRKKRMHRRAVFLGPPALALAVILLGETAASAQVPPLAERFFQEAVTKEEAGQLTEACALFEASVKLEARPASRLRWAQCLERTGKLTAALTELRPLLEIARGVQGDKGAEIQQEIEGHLRTVEGRVARLTIQIPPSQDAIVALDDHPVTAAERQRPILVDPGTHRVTALVGGAKPTSRSIDLKEGESRTLDLSDAFPSPRIAPAPAAPRPVGSSSPTGAPPWRLVVGTGLAGLGLASLGSGLGLAIHTQVMGDRARSTGEGCTEADPVRCDQANLLLDAAKSAQTGAFVSLAVGAALATTGILVLALSSPKTVPAEPKLEAVFRLQGADLRFRW